MTRKLKREPTADPIGRSLSRRTEPGKAYVTAKALAVLQALL